MTHFQSKTRVAEIVLRHDAKAAKPFIVTIVTPSTAGAGNSNPGISRWTFPTIKEARTHFEELKELDAALLIERSQHCKESTKVPVWTVGINVGFAQVQTIPEWQAREEHEAASCKPIEPRFVFKPSDPFDVYEREFGFRGAYPEESLESKPRSKFIPRDPFEVYEKEFGFRGLFPDSILESSFSFFSFGN